MRNETLLDIDAAEKWSGGRELVLADSITCAWCGPTFLIEYAQPALFRHGGYGATEGKRVRSCQCGAFLIVSLFTLNPRG